MLEGEPITQRCMADVFSNASNISLCLVLLIFTHFLLGSSYLQIFLKEFKMFMIVSTYSFLSLDPFKAKDKSAKGPILHNPGNLDLDGPANASTSEGPRNLIIPIEMLPSNRQTPQKDDTGR